MQSRRWGLIAVVALAMAAILLAVTLIRGREPEQTADATLTTTAMMDMTASPSPTALPTPTTPVTYSVQAGDTLSAIAQEHDVSVEALVGANNLVDPDVLQIGQVLIIPDPDDPASPIMTPSDTTVPDSSDHSSIIVLPTMTPSGPALVEIGDATGFGDVEAETITLSNSGGRVSLEDWTLSGPTDDRYVLPALTLFPEGKVRIHSTSGNDTPRDLYWGRTEPAWQAGELVTLRDEDGNVVDTFIVPQ